MRINRIYATLGAAIAMELNSISHLLRWENAQLFFSEETSTAK